MENVIESETLVCIRRLQKLGFRVFPLIVDGKLPPREYDDFTRRATNDFEQARRMFTDPVMGWTLPYNIGIATQRLATGERLVVLDIDKKENDGSLWVAEQELLHGNLLPPTYTQTTPTGGMHFVYKTTVDVRNSASKIAPGVDIRGGGGLLVAAGSSIRGGEYFGNWNQVSDAPEWLLDLCKSSSANDRELTSAPEEISQDYAAYRAERYLKSNAPLAVQGSGGNAATFKVAAALKDFGVNQVDAVLLMLDHWNDRCQPPWESDELQKIVDNAYQYGQREMGVASPEAAFPPLKATAEKGHPLEELNKEFAFIVVGSGHMILWETMDEQNRAITKQLSETAFHRRFAGRYFSIGSGKAKPLTSAWMESRERRSYDGFVFRPGLETPPRYYNLFRGFSMAPSKSGSARARAALNDFLAHGLHNICGGDEKLFRWLIGYFAHLFQRPWEKPLTALVFKGKKGVGKSSFVDTMGVLLGQYYLSVSDRRYLVGNFNSHLETCLLLSLEEAFWSGDKTAEGVLKNLITGKCHVIERKGQEPYKVENCTRVVIVGNEEWIVPASEDERRFAVFSVGDARKQDIPFFERIRRGMEEGGYSLLLDHLLAFDLSEVSINEIPLTEGLLHQKIESLHPAHQWWLDSLTEGHIVNGTSGKWETRVRKSELRDSLFLYLRKRQVRSWMPDSRRLGKLLSLVVKYDNGKIVNEDGTRDNSYTFPDLKDARKQFERFVGHEIAWGAM